MTQKLRLFFGIPVPAPHRTPLQQSAKEIGKGQQWKYTPHANLHLTVCFLGDRDFREVNDIIDKADDILKGFAWPPLYIDRIQIFPSPHPKFIWAILENKESFTDLAQTLEKEFNGTDKREFIPHITLARFRGKRPPKETIQTPYPVLFDYNTILLYSSELTPEGSIYKRVKEWPDSKNQS